MTPELSDAHAAAVDEVARSLATDLEQGLAVGEAEKRLASEGPNRLETVPPPTAWQLFLRQFKDVLIWILIVAAAISGLVLGDVLEAGAIFAIVILNAVIGFTQESGAEQALAKLREMGAPVATVVRNGLPLEVAAETIVPGDRIELVAGDRVPADARVVASYRLTIDEAPLTGESLPVRKQSEPVAADLLVADRLSMVWAGTTVAAGRGAALVTATGTRTEMGKIAELLSEEEPPTPLQVELARTGRRIAVLAGIAALVVFGLGIFGGGSLESVFLIAVALAVAAIPEGLPAVSTITLARGVRRMAEENAVVRRLPSVETLGAAGVICTDKTGTLTRNEMRVQVVRFAGAHEVPASEMGVSAPPGLFERYAAVMALCSDVRSSGNGFIGDPTEVALVHDIGVQSFEAIRHTHPRIDELAFDSNRKMMTTVHDGDGRRLVATKGAPEVVLARCTALATPTGVEPLGAEERQDLLAEAEAMAARGLRTLAAAYRELHVSDTTETAELEQDLVFVAIAGMSDELRPESLPSVQAAMKAGITVVMVTGDHAVTAEAIGQQLGLLVDREVVQGSELRAIPEDGLRHKVVDIGAFARVEPADKVDIVSAWQSHGMIVAMTGDGVNDAPALRKADIGVAMGSGTDVAKEASDVVLTDDNFATIVKAIERGRTIFTNLRQVVYFLLAANISEILVMLVGFLVFASIGEPLLAVQLLWVNLVTDGLPALALGIDPPAVGVMSGPVRSDRDLLGLPHQLRLLWQGAVLALGTLFVFAWAWNVNGRSWDEVRTLGFTALVAVQLVHAFTVRAHDRSVFRTPIDNRWLMTACVVSLIIHLAVVQSSLGELILRTVPMRLDDLWIVAVGALLPFVVIDAVKVTSRRLRPHSPVAQD